MSLVTFLGVDLFRKREGVDLFFIYNDSGAQCQHIVTNAQYITFILMKLTRYQIITNASS